MLPPWLKAWWDIFGEEWTQSILTVKYKDELIGVAPLMIRGEKARVIGSSNVCDYSDFIAAPSREIEVLETVLTYLGGEGVSTLDLGPLREDSSLFISLPRAIHKLGLEVTTDLEDVSVEFDLPPTWDMYMESLSGKQRHEIRRKIRRLNGTGRVSYRIINDERAALKEIDTFLELFVSNRSDKASFMTDQMISYFRSLTEAMAGHNILKLFFMDLDSSPVASTMCFDYKSTFYLYNNGYDAAYHSLSVGLLTKVFTIRDSINNKMVRYNFLKGGEPYKFHLGGESVNLYRCVVTIPQHGTNH